MNVFIRRNILLDVLARREPFNADSALVCTMAETGHITGRISAISLSNLFYTMSR